MRIDSCVWRGVLRTIAGACLAVVSLAATAQLGVGRADFRLEAASAPAREIADWVVASADNTNLPFMVIDKVQARVFAFDARGQLRGATSALLGTAVGDDTVPGIGQRKLSTIRPHERTTPAGRFVAYLDRDIHGEEVLWVDYDSSLSLHRVITTQPRERRAQRLASSNLADKRITYGCINVAVDFYERVVSPLFTRTQGIVYILPETRAANVVFGSFPVKDAAPPVEASGAAPASPAAPEQGPVAGEVAQPGRP